ncbi:hypothetical protein BSTP6_033 [Bacillus phage BSTP6]|uniref:Uncharacterized protein n=2 Tax=Salasvirus phi29 TaxID=10756 RepID=A0A889ING0_9CAUD|nr:putative short tail fiber [Bacillus phage BSTP4]QRD99856.1 hypothetical protein BSTP6_033 [Bacillus phage BSTP6]
MSKRVDNLLLNVVYYNRSKVIRQPIIGGINHEQLSINY